MSKDLVSHALPGDAYAALSAQIDNLRQSMDFLVDLTPEEKSRMVRAGESNMTFTKLIRDLASQPVGILRQAVDFEEFEQDIALYNQLKLLKIKIDPLIELLNDTQTAAGADAYQTALTLYGVAKALNLQGMEEAQRMMAARFSNSGNRTPRGGEDTPEVEEPIEVAEV